MSQEQLQKDIFKKLNDIHHYARLVAEKHEEQDIHEFRVNYKKLRALLRMVHPDRHKAVLPKSLKQLYTIAGTIRDLQLHDKSINSFFAQYDTAPVGYLQHIGKAIAEACRDFDKLYRQCPFSRISHIIKNHFPHKYHKEIKQWQEDNIEAIQLNLLPGITDEAIHEIRKHVKDLVYTEKYMQLETDYHPVAQSIGEYMDSCVLLQLLEDNMSHAPADETPMLEHARQQWQTQKDLLKKVTVNNINQL